MPKFKRTIKNDFNKYEIPGIVLHKSKSFRITHKSLMFHKSIKNRQIKKILSRYAETLPGHIRYNFMGVPPCVLNANVVKKYLAKIMKQSRKKHKSVEINTHNHDRPLFKIATVSVD